MSPQRTFQRSQSSRLNLTEIHLMVTPPPVRKILTPTSEGSFLCSPWYSFDNNFPKRKWLAMTGLTEDLNSSIKPADNLGLPS